MMLYKEQRVVVGSLNMITSTLKFSYDDMAPIQASVNNIFYTGKHNIYLKYFFVGSVDNLINMSSGTVQFA